jgi:hypothetical protein
MPYAAQTLGGAEDLIVGLERVRIRRSVRRGDPQFAHQNILGLDFGIGNPMLALRGDPSAARGSLSSVAGILA